jgi:hypothetical protein
MRTEIVRLSPHQNAKVLAIYAALFSLFFVIVMAVVFIMVRPMDPHEGLLPFPLYLFVLLPVLYFVFGYILVAAACALYNLGFRFIGGLEFEAKPPDTERQP